jgi:hypothetical protein
MRSISRVLIGALCALCVGHATAAHSNEGDPEIDPAVFRSVNRMQLDTAFERIAAQRTAITLYAMLGPSQMDCESATLHEGVETCIVKTVAPRRTAPAALSPN